MNNQRTKNEAQPTIQVQQIVSNIAHCRCGGIAKLEKTDNGHDYDYYIKCQNCGMQTEQVNERIENQETKLCEWKKEIVICKLVEAWNNVMKERTCLVRQRIDLLKMSVDDIVTMLKNRHSLTVTQDAKEDIGRIIADTIIAAQKAH